MKKIIISLCLLIVPMSVNASRGCCSRNGGVCGCTADGRTICCNNDISPTCHCTPPVVYGCTDYNANNYNPNANQNDGSCTYTIRGCTDINANNYNANANENDGSCTYDILGCTDKKAKNFKEGANKDDGSCVYEVLGCMDKTAKNYNEKATLDDKSCIYEPKKEEKQEEEKDIPIENTQEKQNDQSEKENNDFAETVVGLIALGGMAAGGSYEIKKLTKKKEEPKGFKKVLAKFQKKQKKKFPWQ